MFFANREFGWVRFLQALEHLDTWTLSEYLPPLSPKGSTSREGSAISSSTLDSWTLVPSSTTRGSSTPSVWSLPFLLPGKNRALRKLFSKSTTKGWVPGLHRVEYYAFRLPRPSCRKLCLFYRRWKSRDKPVIQGNG